MDIIAAFAGVLIFVFGYAIGRASVLNNDTEDDLY